MRNGVYTEKDGAFPMRSNEMYTEEDGAFPILSRSRSPSSSPRKSARRKSATQKLACALNALKCSSRAGGETDSHAYPSDGTFPSIISDTPHPPLQVGPLEWRAEFNDNNEIPTRPTGRRSSPVDLDEAFEEHEAMNQDETLVEENAAPLTNSSTATVPDSAGCPREITHDGACSGEPGSSSFPMPPERIASEDTHDTPQTSNIDHNKPPKSRGEEESNLSEFCHKYFEHGPPRQVPVFHSAGSLGDSITPTDSPVVGYGNDDDDDDPIFEDDEEDDEEDDGERKQQAKAGNKAETIRLLQLPTTNASSMSASTSGNVVSPPMNDSMDTEETLNGEQISIVSASPAAGTNGEEIQPILPEPAQHDHQAKPVVAESQEIPEEQAGFESFAYHSDASFSTVSSFSEARDAISKPKTVIQNFLNDETRNSSVPPRPFFWRSHPNVTVTSYDLHQPTSRIKAVTPKLTPVNVRDSLSDFQSSAWGAGSPKSDNGRRWKPSRSYAPYIHPTTVRKMWHESQPFQLKINSTWQQVRKGSERHPQGPPSTRSQHPMVQSLASSFAKLPATFGRPDNNSRRSSSSFMSSISP